MNSSVTPPQPPARAPLPKRRLLWIVLAAMALGLLMFLILMMTQRGQQPFFSAGPGDGTVDENGQVQVFEPLPAPLPAGAAGDGSLLPGMADVGEDRAQPRIIEQPRRAPTPAAKPSAPTRTPAAAAPSRSAATSAPVPTNQPAPRYPRNALRSGIEGTVQVQVEVGADGVPTSVSLASGSGSRELDRAAMDAVRRWRFSPAMANGQPTAGRVTVPIKFTVNN
ncbi:MAG: energy transducer TonB [Xanthomonadaceae bacterium]|nr:energy transducer TonB [Xanthomonadaceae bacterium]